MNFPSRPDPEAPTPCHSPDHQQEAPAPTPDASGTEVIGTNNVSRTQLHQQDVPVQAGHAQAPREHMSYAANDWELHAETRRSTEIATTQ